MADASKSIRVSVRDRHRESSGAHYFPRSPWIAVNHTVGCVMFLGDLGILGGFCVGSAAVANTTEE